MGVYSDGNIYGISWYIYDKYGEFIRKYEKIFPEAPSRAYLGCGAAGLTEDCGSLRKTSLIQEIKKEYCKLTINECKYAKFKIYKFCTTTYYINFNNEYGTFMCWYPANKRDIIRILKI